jgi:hypothetical protein
MNATALTPQQIEEYQLAGLTRLPGAVPRADAVAMADVLWAELARKHLVLKDRPETWTKPHPAQLSGPSRRGGFAAMASPAVRAAVDHVLGPSGWSDPARWGLPLATFPAPGPWDITHQHWHLDALVRAGLPDPPVARVFVILAPLAPRSGGTLFALGSHRLLARAADEEGCDLASAVGKTALKQRYSWFAELCSQPYQADRTARLMGAGGEAGGVAVRVVEMTGEPGDAFLMHPYLLHTFSPNRGTAPRLVLTQWVYGREASAG